MQVDFAQPAKRKEQQLSLLVFNPLTVLVYRDEMTIEQDKSLLLWHCVTMLRGRRLCLRKLIYGAFRKTRLCEKSKRFFKRRPEGEPKGGGLSFS